MKRDDIAKLIYSMQAAYPRHFPGMNVEKTKAMLDIWESVFSEDDAGEVFKGLKIYLRSDTKGFPPSPGQIVECMKQLDPNENMNEMEAWTLVEKAVRNSGYEATEEFNKLPQIIRRVVRTPARLKEWSQMDLADFQTVEQSNFMRSYRAELEKEKANEKIPTAIRPKLGEIADIPSQIEQKDERKTGPTPDEALEELIRQLGGVQIIPS